MLFLSQFSDACAAGPYDGEWTGSATATDGRCKPAIVTLTVLGRAVTGQARFVSDTPNINGTVREDGTFGATTSSNGSRIAVYSYAAVQAQPQNFIPIINRVASGYDTKKSAVAFNFDAQGVLTHTTSPGTFFTCEGDA
jgi:hypothetical protein